MLEEETAHGGSSDADPRGIIEGVLAPEPMKACNTPNSKKHFLALAAKLEGPPPPRSGRKAKKQRYRDKKKNRKLDAISRVQIGAAAPGVRTYSADELKAKSHFFKYVPVGTKELETKCENDGTLTVEFNETTMHIPRVTEEGCQAIDEKTRQLLFRLVPREKVPTNPGTVEREANAIHAHEYTIKTGNGIKRGASHAFRTNYKYVILGAKAFPGGVSQTSVPEGIVTSPFDSEFQVDAELHMDKVRKRMECSFREYVTSDELRSLKVSLEAVDCNNAPNSNFSSMACSNDFSAAAHVDKDFGLSVLHLKAYLMDDTRSEEERVRCNLADDPEAAIYFVLPERGLAIPVRPGDMLIFNPLIFHCASEKTAVYGNHRVKAYATYLKAGIVPGNSNKVDLTPEQQKAFEHHKRLDTNNKKRLREETNEGTSKQGRPRHADREVEADGACGVEDSNAHGDVEPDRDQAEDEELAYGYDDVEPDQDQAEGEESAYAHGDVGPDRDQDEDEEELLVRPAVAMAPEEHVDVDNDFTVDNDFDVGNEPDVDDEPDDAPTDQLTKEILGLHRSRFLDGGDPLEVTSRLRPRLQATELQEKKVDASVPKPKSNKYPKCQTAGKKKGKVMYVVKGIVGHVRAGGTDATPLYDVEVLWGNDSKSMVSLKTFGEDLPVDCANYAEENGLLDDPAWRRFNKYLSK